MFRLGPGSGRDLIGDFAPGIDRLQLSGFGSFEAMQAAMRDGPGGVSILLDEPSDAVVLRGVAAASLTAADVILA